MDSNKKYIVEIRFSSLEELEKFEQEYKKFREHSNSKGAGKSLKVDLRGSKTKQLHQRVKEYLKNHPISYKEAMKVVGKMIKEGIK